MAVSVSAASLPLPAGAAQDGSDATGVSQLSGGAGIRGWLSSIYSALLNGTLKVQLQSGGATQSVTAAASSASGASIWSAEGGTGTALLSNSAVTVQGSATSLYTLIVDNTMNPSVVTYLQFFDAASPTVGTTAPKFVIPVPAGGYWSQGFGTEGKIAFSTALTVAATNTRTGGAAPSNAVAVTLIYK